MIVGAVKPEYRAIDKKIINPDTIPYIARAPVSDVA